jgi:hypothetical protein
LIRSSLDTTLRGAAGADVCCGATTAAFGAAAGAEVVAVGGGVVAGIVVAADAEPAPTDSPAAPITAITSPTFAVDDAGIMIFNNVPLKNDSISRLALSVSTSAKISPRETCSPSFFFQVRILPELMVSLSCGIFTSVAIDIPLYPK